MKIFNSMKNNYTFESCLYEHYLHKPYYIYKLLPMLNLKANLVSTQYTQGILRNLKNKNFYLSKMGSFLFIIVTSLNKTTHSL